MIIKFLIRYKKVFRYLVILFCIGGFCYQSYGFFQLYAVYPTVVDIQDTSPSYLEIPSITFCNPIGYNYKTLCDYRAPNGMKVGACVPKMVNTFIQPLMCRIFRGLCGVDEKVPKDYQMVLYTKFMDTAVLKPEDHDRIRVPLESYLQCSLEFGGIKKECNLSNVMGSFFTKTEMPQFCYGIYSLWGNPGGQREKIPKGSVMHLRFTLNTTMNLPEVPTKKDEEPVYEPRYNLPDSASIQMSVHSPYFLPSPFNDGYNYIGGRAYDLRVTMKETHRLPAPYETNCTDYMKLWRERGGKAPVDQLGVVQECRMNKSIESRNCIPMDLDYPRTDHAICTTNCLNCTDETSTNDCITKAQGFLQPCDSISYTTVREDRTISIFETINLAVLRKVEKTRIRLKEHDCVGTKMWRPECGTIDIDILFDRFEISNLTYKPKFESLELFSVVGGYVGMWLGISLVTIYDVLGTLFKYFFDKIRKKNRRRVKPDKLFAVKKRKPFSTSDKSFYA